VKYGWIKGVIFLVFWLLWMVLSPFCLMGAIFLYLAKEVEESWKPWIKMEIEPFEY